MAFRVRYGRWITPHTTRTAEVPNRATVNIALIEDYQGPPNADLATLWSYVYEPEAILTTPVPSSSGGSVYSNEWNSFIGTPVAPGGFPDRTIQPGLSGIYTYAPIARVSGDPIPVGRAVGPDTALDFGYITEVGARHSTSGGANAVINSEQSASWHVPDVKTAALLPPYEDVTRPLDVYTVEFETTMGTIVGSTVDLVINDFPHADVHASLPLDDDIRVLATSANARTATPGATTSSLVADDYDFYHVPNAWLTDQLWDTGHGPFMATYQPSSVLAGTLDPQRVATILGVTTFTCHVMVTYRGPRFRYVYHDTIVPAPDLRGAGRSNTPGFYTPHPAPIGVR